MYLLLSVSPYPNSALSAGELIIIAVVPVLALAHCVLPRRRLEPSDL